MYCIFIILSLYLFNIKQKRVFYYKHLKNFSFFQSPHKYKHIIIIMITIISPKLTQKHFVYL